MQNALEISIKFCKNINAKMTVQNAEAGTIILVSLLMIGALVAIYLFLDFKREELIFKREELVFKRERLKMKETTQNRKQMEKERKTQKLDQKLELETEIQQSDRKKRKKRKRR